MRGLIRRPETVPAILLIVAFAVGVLGSPYFLDATYLLDRTTIFAETGLMVLGMTFVIVCGQIDLSVASILGLSACIAAKVGTTQPPMAAVSVGVLTGALLGLVNGVLVAYAKLPSFLVTLGTLALYRGIAQAMAGSSSIVFPDAITGFDQLYLPYPVPMALVLVLVFAIGLGAVLHRSVLGRWVYATGSNEQAAVYSAIPVPRVKLFVFVLSGFLAGIGGLLMNSRLGVARFDHARGFELDVITATVLGGTSIYGGKGSILGAVLAFFLVFFVRTGLGIANVKPEHQLTIIGGLLVLTVGLNLVLERGARLQRA